MTPSKPPVRPWLATLLLLAAPALHAAPVQWALDDGGNGHWYDYIPATSIFSGVGFDTARAAALGSTHAGLSGYLATVTSAAEQSFIQSSFGYLVGFGASGTAWLGASDTAQEGTWRWLDGPEAGQALGYTAWRPGQPLALPDNHDLLALHINAVVVGAPDYGWVAVNSDGGALGYVIEYGSGAIPAVPEPRTLLLMLAGLAAFRWRLPRRQG